MNLIKKIPNWIGGHECAPLSNSWISKYNPHTGKILSEFADSTNVDVQSAVRAAIASFSEWSQQTPVRRGQILNDIVNLMKQNATQLAECIALETGKPPADAAGEVNAAILQAEYWAGEGMRLHGRSLTSGMPGKYSHIIRQPIGVAGLIVPANTPIANIAWKTFPALICGNTVVLKAAEDAPNIALLFAQLTKEAGISDGVFNVIQGNGKEAGSAIVTNNDISIISFTGSTEVGKWIAEMGGRRLARVSLELGGKNPFVVCDDADIDLAVHWASLSAFSNAGQRCAAGSRIFIFDNVYNEFRDKLVAKAKNLKIGIEQGCDLGPVVNKRQQTNILAAIQQAEADGGIILCGGKIPDNSGLSNGFYIQPTVIEGLNPSAKLSCTEIFGPVVTLHSVSNLKEALEFANATEYGLTAAIHTTNVDRAMWFAQRVKAGVANINLGTFGSEPHMPFGGFGASGNGTREPGLEALDIYSEIKNISFLTRNNLI
jgi:acyl-CoA reductase-like NAD-dependent aldehyde dehydrogenase